MKEDEKKIACPKCGTEIDVNRILYRQVDEELKQKYREELEKEQSKFRQQSEELQQQRKRLEEERQEQGRKVEAAIKEGLKKEEKLLKEKLLSEIREESSEQMKVLQDELKEKSTQLKEFNKAKSEIERLKREKEELKDAIEAEAERKISKTVSEEKEKIRKSEEEKSHLRIVEKEKIIEQLNEQLKDAQRKAEQGSMQLQGEVQELAIEEWLSVTFPYDTITEVKKGARGADCLQIVNTPTRQNCGSIYYESKRTKGFQPSWIEKFKGDIREKNADIGVLVTESMPSDMPRMGLREGVWVCSFEEFRGLCVVLRESLIRLSAVMTTQQNKGDKMGMLYDYLTGQEFHLQVEAIVEGFTQMHADLEAEKRAMNGIWKKREKQIEKVLGNTTLMYGSIKGIAGNAFQSVPQLELPTPDEDP